MPEWCADAYGIESVGMRYFSTSFARDKIQMGLMPRSFPNGSPPCSQREPVRINGDGEN